MEEKKSRRRRRVGVGAWIARAFWLCVLTGSAWCVYEQYRLGEWPWPRPGRLAGIQLLARDEWNAEKPKNAPGPMGRPQRITIHHLGGGIVNDSSQEAVGRTIKAIQTEHMRQRGWSDIGYHFIVDRSGRVWEGRLITQTGAHAGSQAANDRNIGIVVLGNFDRQTLAPAQDASLERLVEGLRWRYQISRNQVLSHKQVRGDCGLGTTECPGKHLLSWIDGYRSGPRQAATSPASGGARTRLVRS